MAKLDLKDAGIMLVGAAAGAAISRYGSDAISNAMTKKERELAAPAVANVKFYHKAPFWDVVLGVAAGGAGVYMDRSRKSHEVALGLEAAGAYLVANGVLDLIGDMTAEDAVKQFNGRPLSKAPAVGPNPGPMSRARGVASPMSRVMAQQRTQTVAAAGEQVALF